MDSDTLAQHRSDPRLNPPRHSDRFYHLRVLRDALEGTAGRYLSEPKDRILVDFGCGTMPYRPIFQRYVTQYIGIDLPGRPAADFAIDSNSRTRLPDDFADVVLSTQVLEHVGQPLVYLEECYRLLKPNGLLILSTHGYWMYHPDPQDLWRWTGEGLRRTIEEIGFRVLDFRGLMGLASTAVHLLQDALIPKMAGFIRPSFALIMQHLAILADRYHSPQERAADACVFLSVAMKPEANSQASGGPRVGGERGGFRIASSAMPGRTWERAPGQDPKGLVVCIISPNESAYSETFIRAHIERLPARVKILYGGWFPSYSGDGRPLLPTGFYSRLKQAALRRVLRLSAQGLQARALRHFLQSNNVEIVLAEYGPTGASVMDACLRVGVPFVVHFHGFDASERTTLERYGSSYRGMFAAAGAVIAVSRNMEHQLLALGAPREKLFYNPYGVDTEVFSGADPASASPVFIAVGRFVDKKAPHLTLLAFKKVTDISPDARLIMIGDGELWEACKQLASALGIDHAVEFLGPRPHAEVAATMRTSRAFVQHSIQTSYADSEGMSVAVLEAGAAGLPVVSTWHGGIKDAVIHGETGFLVGEGDVEAMADYMIRLAKDRELAAILGRRGRAHVRDNFPMEKSIANLWGILERVAGKK